MARSWPSTRTAAPISRCSRPSSAQTGVGGLVYQPFDLLYLDGRSLLDVPLEDRKRLLQSVLRDHPRVRFAAHIDGEGEAFFEAAAANRLEGMIAKLRRSRYEPGRRSKRLAQAQGPARAGAGHRRLDAGRGQRPRPRRAGGGLLRRRQAEVRAARSGRASPARSARSCSRSSSRSPSTTRPTTEPPPKDYKGRWGGDLGVGDLGPARARDARGARRLDARRRRPPDRLQGTRAGSRPD